MPYNHREGYRNRVNYQELKAIVTFLITIGTIFVALPMAVGAADETPLMECFAAGCIDWGAGVVRASGIGAPCEPENVQPPQTSPAGITAAQKIARDRLLSTVTSVRVANDVCVVTLLGADETFQEGLNAMIEKAPVTRREYLSDGTVKIELGMKLTGGFAQLVLPEEIRQVEAVTAVVNTPPHPPTVKKLKPNEPVVRPYTGLIVDTTGTGARPALVPSIVDESGHAIYGPAFVSREFAVSRGVSGFAATQETALQNSRVGDHPMIIRAIRTQDNDRTALVIANTDAARLRSSADHLDFLKACRVCIVIDAPFDSTSNKETPCPDALHPSGSLY